MALSESAAMLEGLSPWRLPLKVPVATGDLDATCHRVPNVQDDDDPRILLTSL